MENLNNAEVKAQDAVNSNLNTSLAAADEVGAKPNPDYILEVRNLNKTFPLNPDFLDVLKIT